MASAGSASPPQAAGNDIRQMELHLVRGDIGNRLPRLNRPGCIPRAKGLVPREHHGQRRWRQRPCALGVIVRGRGKTATRRRKTILAAKKSALHTKCCALGNLVPQGEPRRKGSVDPLRWECIVVTGIVAFPAQSRPRCGVGRPSLGARACRAPGQKPGGPHTLIRCATERVTSVGTTAADGKRRPFSRGRGGSLNPRSWTHFKSGLELGGREDIAIGGHSGGGVVPAAAWF